jgi:Peptidase family M41
MVTRWGFSDELGTVMYGDNNQDEIFLGYSIGRQQTVSEATAQKIDAEVRRLVESGLAEATEIITEKRQDLETLAKGLLEYETLTGEEIVGLLKGHPPVRDTCSDPEPPLRGSAVPPPASFVPNLAHSQADWNRNRRHECGRKKTAAPSSQTLEKRRKANMVDKILADIAHQIAIRPQ